MTKLIRLAGIILGVIGLILVSVLVIGFLLPSGWSTERQALIPAPPEEVFPHLESARGWELWSPSPTTGFQFFGPEAGEGSGRRWDDDQYGEGEFVITSSTPPDSLRYEVEVEGGAIRIEGRMVLERREEGGTRIHWREEGDFGWNPLLGFLAGRMDDLQGAQLEASLESLRRLVVEGRRFDPEELEGDEAGEEGTGEEGPGEVEAGELEAGEVGANGVAGGGV